MSCLSFLDSGQIGSLVLQAKVAQHFNNGIN